MKTLKALFVLALVAFFAAPAFAETQNVKVSGSIDAYFFNRTNYDLQDNNDASVLGVGGTVSNPDIDNRSERDTFFMSITQVEVAADLTDNVSTVINLVNQRDWNTDTHQGGDATGTATSTSNNEFDVTLDLAYVQMKEIFYSPLTLTIGRQDIWWGRGFILGNNNTAWDPQGTIQANEYSATTAFDAVRATLDFNPWTVDAIYSKILENASNSEDDKDIFGTNITYKFSEYNAVAEGYWLSEVDRATLSTSATTRNNDTHTIGGRVQFDPISQITLGAELGYQFGNATVTAATNPERDRSAWAFDIFGTYRFDNAWKPEITLEYVSFSGESDLTTTSSADFGGWNGLYRGKFWTAYADFREFVYGTLDGVDQSATTNQEFIQIKGSMKPMDDLLLEASFTYLWNNEDVATPLVTSTAVRNDNIGYEVDLQTTYDYTEDVTFGTLVGFFVPGDFYNSPIDETALDIVSSVKVSF